MRGDITMDIQSISQIISALGFPIAVCLICFWYINKKDENHKNEMDKMSEAINNNTAVMQKLINKLEG